jgi:glycosyltransferase involved in cell wall biosynthesis
VLYVIDSLAPGGAETSLAAMAAHLIAHGIDLDVAYFKDVPGVHQQLIDAGADLIHVGERGGRLGRAWAIRRLIVARRPDLVHTTLFEADIAGRLGAFTTRAPVVSSLVNTPYGPEHRAAVPSGARLRLAYACDAVTARTVRRFHANSHDTAAVMSRRFAVRPAKIDVVPRGRSALALGRRTAERRNAVRTALGLPDTTPVVLAVARHDHAKGLDLLIRAVPGLRAERPDAVVLVAGAEGPHTAELRRLLATLDPGDAAAVTFLGRRNDVADLLAAADVLAFPSRKEGLPGTLIEALALECPIVAADIPPIREVVGEPPAALLVAPQDVAALASALARVIEDDDVRRSLVATARQRFEEHFTIERSSAEMVAFYRRALSPGAHRR